MRKIFVPLKEDVKKRTPALDKNAKEEVVNVALNEGTIKDTLHTWISIVLRICAG